MRLVLLAGILAAIASPTLAQTSVPGSAGGGTAPSGLVGHISGFGDAPSGAGGGAASSPINTNPAGSLPVGGLPNEGFRPAGLMLFGAAQPATGSGVQALNGSANGSAPVLTAASGGVGQGMTGGVGPRRFGFR